VAETLISTVAAVQAIIWDIIIKVILLWAEADQDFLADRETVTTLPEDQEITALMVQVHQLVLEDLADLVQPAEVEFV
jgi:hypothetical protein